MSASYIAAGKGSIPKSLRAVKDSLLINSCSESCVLIKAALTDFTSYSESAAKIEIHIPMTASIADVVTFALSREIKCILDIT